MANRKSPPTVRSLARSHTTMAIRTLQGIALRGKNENARVAAAIHLLDRGWGRVHPDPEDGERLTITIKQIVNGRLEVVGNPKNKSNGHKPPLTIEHDPNEGHDK